MTFGDKVKQLRKQKGWTQEELAKKIGVTSQAVQKYEKNKIVHISVEMMKTLADIYNVDPTYFLDLDYDFGDEIDETPLPVLGEVACGEPRYAEQNIVAYSRAGSKLNADFCLVAHGDSMIGARILDGDVVFIRRQNAVDNGDIAVVLIGDEATLKRVYFDRTTNILTLCPENPAYKPLRFVGNELNNVHILGKAVGFQSMQL